MQLRAGPDHISTSTVLLFPLASQYRRSEASWRLNLMKRLVLQVHAQHGGRALRGGGGLPLRPGGDAAGRPGEPTSLPRRLRPQRLGPLEPLQPGENRSRLRAPAQSTASAARDGGISDWCETRWDLSWYFFFSFLPHTFPRGGEFQGLLLLWARRQLFHLEVDSHSPRWRKEMKWLKSRRKRLIDESPVLLCSVRKTSSRHVCAEQESNYRLQQAHSVMVTLIRNDLNKTDVLVKLWGLRVEMITVYAAPVLNLCFKNEYNKHDTYFSWILKHNEKDGFYRSSPWRPSFFRALYCRIFFFYCRWWVLVVKKVDVWRKIHWQ